MTSEAKEPSEAARAAAVGIVELVGEYISENRWQAAENLIATAVDIVAASVIDTAVQAERERYDAMEDHPTTVDLPPDKELEYRRRQVKGLRKKFVEAVDECKRLWAVNRALSPDPPTPGEGCVTCGEPRHLHEGPFPKKWHPFEPPTPGGSKP